jgi:spore protease
MKNVRTDLALEMREGYRQKNTNVSEVPGVDVEVRGNNDISVTRVKVTSQQGVEAIGKPMGNYITIEAGGIKSKDEDVLENVSRTVAQELHSIINIGEKSCVLVVGLGNWNVTPDALGPKVISKIMVTRHLLEHVPDKIDDSVRPVAALSPGVLGLTGIETGEIIKGLVDRIKPDLVIAIDALASRRMNRVGTTIQIADTGINPGSGVGNNRMSLSEKHLGVPVIALGVPTVVDAATMANDTIDLIINSMIKEVEEGTEFYNTLKNMEKEEKLSLINQILSPHIGNMMVTPKEVDTMVDDIANILANGLNIALHKGIGPEDVNRYIQ